jgi:TPR repeat protein
MCVRRTNPFCRVVTQRRTGKTKWIGRYLLWIGLVTPMFAAQAATENKSFYATTSSAIRNLGFQARWMKGAQQRAMRAMQDKQPYLANRLFRQLALDGNREAAYRLGLFYDTSRSADHDPARALYWYRRAAAAGEIHALHNLGVAYANGKGVAMDMQQAIKWWTLAARRGNADSQYNLGILYAAGDYGITRNLEQARHWWREAALNGDAMAQYNLGTLYVNSDVRDYCKAARWWKAAASNGVEQASLALRLIKRRQDYHSCR